MNATDAAQLDHLMDAAEAAGALAPMASDAWSAEGEAYFDLLAARDHAPRRRRSSRIGAHAAG